MKMWKVYDTSPKTDNEQTFDQLTWALNWSVLKINQNMMFTFTYSSVIMEENATL